MGFSCGFYWAKKINDEVTMRDIESVQAYMEYYKSEWAKNHFGTVKSYVTECREYDMPSQELLDFYMPLAYINEYGYTEIFHEVGTWYSGSSFMYDWITSHVEKIEAKDCYATAEISKEEIIDLLSYVFNLYEEEVGEPAMIERAFRVSYENKEDEYEEDYDNTVITSFPCDGVEATIIGYEDESRSIIRVYSGDEYESPVLINKTGLVDVEKIHICASIIKSCFSLLRDVDWDTCKVFFSGGW